MIKIKNLNDYNECFLWKLTWLKKRIKNIKLFNIILILTQKDACTPIFTYQLSSVQSYSHVQLFATPRTAAHQASRSITSSQSPLKLMSIESGMPSNHLTLCCPLLLLPSIFPSIRVFSRESALRIRWTKCWSLSFGILPKTIQDRFPLGLTGLISLQSNGLSSVYSNTTVQKHQFFGAQLSLESSSDIHT